MESSTLQAPQTLGQSPFFYYNPHPKPEHRQHGHFSPHPRGATSQVHEQPLQRNLYASTVGHSRAPSSGSQARLRCPSPYSGALSSGLNPTVSPRPAVQQKPTILINDDYGSQPMSLQIPRPDHDVYLFPSTPPLSVSASTMGSPLSSCGLMATPGEGSLFHGQERYQDIKPSCEPDMTYRSELRSMALAGGDWSWIGSPPLTPRKSPPTEQR